MKKIIDSIINTNDLKNLNYNEKNELATEIREELISTVSKTGGHLASNLGVVELTIALHSVFNTPTDKIVWDVGHQTYVHKILTGRKDKMHTLRKFNGVAGFPKSNESEYDAFNTGHSSTSISVVSGMARARDIKKENNKIIAVIGDGAITGGMALEALNDIGSSNTDVTIILNDNEMSISKNVGGISFLLSKLRTRKLYSLSNNITKQFIKKIPFLGKGIIKLVRKIKRLLKQVFIQNMYFEDIGFTYLGPVDGHNIEHIESILKLSNNIKGPKLLHIITKKGKGYKYAEETPDKYHAISAFDVETGQTLKKSQKDYANTFGDTLVKLAEKNKKIVAITAAMKDGTGLSNFSKKFPDRFFDVGIAEQHALAMAAGMAKNNLIPVVPIYSSFLQRGYDQIIHDICIQKLPVIIGIDRAGCVGNDGETHQGLFDLSFLSVIPNLTIMAPKDYTELEKMLEFAVNLNKPVAIRYPRGVEKNIFNKCEEIIYGKAEILSSGEDISIIAIGNYVSKAYSVMESLKNKNINAEVINVRFLKEFDRENIKKSIEKTRNVIVLEDNINRGGLSSIIKELIVEEKINNVEIKIYSYPDEFVKHGSIEELEKLYNIDNEHIIKNVLKKVVLA